MSRTSTRRALLGAGGLAAVGLGAGSLLRPRPEVQAAAADVPTPRVPVADLEQAAQTVRDGYEAASAEAGGWWRAHIAVFDGSGTEAIAVDHDADDVIQAWSVNKAPIAAALLDKVDRGEAALTDRVEVTEDVVSYDGDGIFGLDGAYPSSVTLGHALAVMLTVSDNTATKLCGQAIDAFEINEFLADRGWPDTQVQPTSDDGRQFYVGLTTPRQQFELWRSLAAGELLSQDSRRHLLAVLRSPVAFNEGVRQRLPTPDRERIAAKGGWFDSDGEDERAEAGAVFDVDGRVGLIYSVYAGGHGAVGDFGAAHPANRARAAMGEVFLEVVDGLRAG